jgi:hypothetical protein
MEFLELKDLRSRADAIRAAFETLLDPRTLVSRRNAKQWQFLRQCLDRTLGGGQAFEAGYAAQLAQYKFEIEDKLRRYYLRPGQPVDFVFHLAHSRDALRERLAVGPDYPQTGGYLLLIRDNREGVGDAAVSASEERVYIEKVVAACIDAEFVAYQALPIIDESGLSRWFHPKGAAYRDIVHTLNRVARRGWVLTNTRNPSTKRLLAITVKGFDGDRAVARTTEYWYLRWWSTREGRYRYPYRETNRQTYVLVRAGEHWLVEENIRPAPRSSTPHRRK